MHCGQPNCLGLPEEAKPADLESCFRAAGPAPGWRPPPRGWLIQLNMRTAEFRAHGGANEAGTTSCRALLC
jgi:hypothetical protein